VLLPSNEVATVEALARGLFDTLKGALAAAGGDAAAIEDKFIKPLNITGSEFLLPALICLHDTRKEALQQLIHSATNNAELEKALTEPHDFAVNELAVYRLDGGVPLVLEHTLLDVTALRVAPAGAFVAFLRGEKLVIASLAGGTNRFVAAEKAMGHFDWTPDGKALLYAVPLAEKWDASGINLFRLERRTVMDEHGVLTAGAVQPLAQAAANFEPRVRCLPD